MLFPVQEIDSFAGRLWGNIVHKLECVASTTSYCATSPDGRQQSLVYATKTCNRLNLLSPEAFSVGPK